MKKIKSPSCTSEMLVDHGQGSKCGKRDATFLCAVNSSGKCSLLASIGLTLSLFFIVILLSIIYLIFFNQNDNYTRNNTSLLMANESFVFVELRKDNLLSEFFNDSNRAPNTFVVGLRIFSPLSITSFNGNNNETNTVAFNLSIGTKLIDMILDLYSVKVEMNLPGTLYTIDNKFDLCDYVMNIDGIFIFGDDKNKILKISNNIFNSKKIHVSTKENNLLFQAKFKSPQFHELIVGSPDFSDITDSHNNLDVLYGVDDVILYAKKDLSEKDKGELFLVAKSKDGRDNFKEINTVCSEINDENDLEMECKVIESNAKETKIKISMPKDMLAGVIAGVALLRYREVGVGAEVTD